MRKKIYKLIMFYTLPFLGTSAFSQDEVMYVGKGGTQSDSMLVAYLEDEGYTVTMVLEVDYKEAAYQSADAYADYDVVVFSENVGSGSVVNYKTAGFPIPCVALEGYAVRSNRWGFLEVDEEEFKQLSSADLDDDVKKLVVLDSDNHITEDYSEDDEIIWTSKPDNTNLGVTGFLLDEHISDAIPLMAFKNAAMEEFPTLWAIPEGSVNDIDDSEIPSNIVLFGVIDPGLGMYATPEFNELVVRCIEWATDDYEKVGISNEYAHSFELISGPNPTSGPVDFSFTLNESADVVINLYDITGKLVKSINAGYFESGFNNTEINLSDLPASQYIYEFVINDESLTGKVFKY